MLHLFLLCYTTTVIITHYMSVVMDTITHTHITLGWPNMYLMGTNYFSFKGECNPHYRHYFTQHNCLYFNSVMERKNYLHYLRMASYVSNGNKLCCFQRRAKSKLRTLLYTTQLSIFWFNDAKNRHSMYQYTCLQLPSLARDGFI